MAVLESVQITQNIEKEHNACADTLANRSAASSELADPPLQTRLSRLLSRTWSSSKFGKVDFYLRTYTPVFSGVDKR